MRNVGDFLDALTAKISAEEIVDGDRRLKLASLVVECLEIIHRKCFAGKTRAIVTPIAGTTRDAIDSILKFHGEEKIY